MEKLYKIQRPEPALLLCCIRTRIDEITRKRVNELLRQNPNWNHLLKLAEKHRVIQLLYRTLHVAAGNDIPSAVLHNLRGRFYANTRNNFLINNELLALLPLFRDSGIPVIPYKGILLAISVYGKVSFRQIWDLDLLVRREDFDKSQTLLTHRGYSLKERYDRERSFFHEHKQVEVDLHWGLTPVYFRLDLNFDELYERQDTIALNNKTIRTFSAEDLLLILCIQIAKDCWERRQHIEHLAKVCDISELLHSRPLLNWPYITNKAEALGVSRILHFGLRLARDLLGAPLPLAASTSVDNDTVARSLVQQVSANLFTHMDDSFAPPRNSLLDLKLRTRQLVFYFRLRERLGDRLHHLLQISMLLARLGKVGRISCI